MSQAHGQSPLLGIDLGAATATMALFGDDGKARVVPNAEGKDNTPAALHFYDADGFVIGDEAVKMAALDPESTVRFIPTWLGEAERTFDLKGLTFTAQELLALLMMKLRDDANDLHGTQVEQAVLAVPSFFDSAQRQAVQDAALIGGIEVLGVYPRATAALLGAGLDIIPDPARALVVNMGGTSLEAAVLGRRGKRVRTFTARADEQLGARDFEQRMSEHLAVAFEAAHGVGIAEDPQILQQFLDNGQFALEALAAKPKVALQIGHGHTRLVKEVTRDELISWTSDLVDRARVTIDDALQSAEVSPDRLQAIILVGTASRLPGLREAIAAGLGREPLDVLDPHTVAARGVALAGVLEHQQDHPGLSARPKPTLPPPDAPTVAPSDGGPTKLRNPFAASIGLADGGHGDEESDEDLPTQSVGTVAPVGLEIEHVTTRSLGIIVLDRHRRERVMELIPEGTALPFRFRARFVYAYPNMTAVRVEVTEGTGTKRDEVSVIGVVELDGLPPRPMGTPIEVVYVYGRNQILQVRVVDVDSGLQRDVRIRYRGGLSAEELKAAAARTRSLKG